ncbi:hypothetical protein [Chryseobacterium phocaeense]|uniref:hypothetical protein n=1 Tax=Chryseobacterium phocaeense TaxID=1816690 RepID=UPI00111B2E0F|nr:hypothetical protein [Chryseobacterium phocaeense]
MIKIFSFYFILLSFSLLFSQNINEYNKILKIENQQFNSYEIRIYQKSAISTGLDLFKLYKDREENWFGEYYRTEVAVNREIKIKKSNVNLPGNPQLVWAQILATDVLHFPKWESIRYKLEKKNGSYLSEEGEVLSSTSQSYIVDGISYYVKIKNGENENEIEYDNPESYLKMYPLIDELIFFNKLLSLLKKEFKIFNNN